jgi:copper oxidase (laccase) domain-containing protein
MKLVFKNKLFEIYFSSKEDGNVAPRFSNDAIGNRNKLLSSISAKSTVRMRTSSNRKILNLKRVKESVKWMEHSADGLVSYLDKTTCLALFPADCIPLVIWSEKCNLLGLFHVARKNAEAGYLESIISALRLEHGAETRDLSVYVGPAIKRDSYFFQTIDRHQLHDKKWKGHIQFKNGNYHVDVLGFVIAELERLGVTENQIEIDATDTGANDYYFSHSKSARTGELEGRNMFIIKPTGKK